MEEHPILSENEKIALRMGGESTSRIMTLDGKTADKIIEERNVANFNQQVDKYVDKLNKHAENLETYSERIAKDIENIEIMPIGNYVLVKEFEDNPFQRITRDAKTGLITDLGGLKPQYKNTDNGQIEEEESFIKVGVIQEVGPECKWCQPNDTVMYTVPSKVPVPFFKQGLILVNETRVLVTINTGLKERFNNIKNEKEWIDLSEIPESLGSTINERINKWLEYKAQGIILKETKQ